MPEESTLLETGRPKLLEIAHQGDLAIQLPVSQQSVTALAYHGANTFALPLEPAGRQVNQGILSRIYHRLVGDDQSGVTYYQLTGGEGSRRARWTSERRPAPPSTRP